MFQCGQGVETKRDFFVGQKYSDGNYDRNTTQKEQRKENLMKQLDLDVCL